MKGWVDGCKEREREREAMRPAQTSLEKHKEQQRDHTERVEQDTRLQHRIVFTAIRMRNTFSIAIVLLVVLTFTVEASMKKKEKGKEPKAEVECSEWQYGKCVPNSGDCGTGIREGTCNEQTKKTKCKVPCNWKKDFGADCKYKFGRWAECDMTTGTRSRSGTLKKALFNAECQTAIKVSKPCTQKTPKPKGGEKKKGKGKEN